MKADTVKAVVVFFLMFVLPQPAMADYGAVATGKDGSYGWASRQSQNEAERAALKACNRVTPKKNCAIIRTKAIATATGRDIGAMGFSAVGVADARRRALAACGAGCKVTELITTPGFYARAVSGEKTDGGTYGHLSYGSDDRDDIVRKAVDACAARSGVQCEITEWGVIPGRIKVGKPAVPALTPGQGDCRPATPALRCELQCVNGSCTVTYENGCRIRVQVQPRFDGFTNQWVYPSPAC